MSLLAVAISALLLTACGNDDSLDESGSSEWAGSDFDEGSERELFDEEAARADAEADVTAEGYSGPCTYDCSGHEAGFGYAAEGNPDGGTSDSQSFDEGQEAYEQAVEERVEEARSDYEDGEEQF